MNAKNGPSAMNGNKLRFLAAVIASALAVCGAAPVLAVEGSAPAMSGIQEMVVQDIRFGSEEKKTICGIKPDQLYMHIVKSLKNFGLPAMSVLEAKPVKMGTARIEIVPEVLSSNSQGIECTSWVSLTAQSHNTVKVLPIETPRNLIVTYWRANVLVSSIENSHFQVLKDSFDKLIRKLAQQYKMDQPPPLPPLEEQN